MATSCAYYFQQTLHSAQRHGIDPDDLLAEIGLDKDRVFDPSWRGDVELLARLVQLMWFALDDEFMGFLARPARPGTFAMMTYGIITEPSLEAALRKGVLFYQLITDAMTMSLDGDRQQLRLSIEFASLDLDPSHYFLEFWATIWYRLIGWLAGSLPPLTAATFSYPRPVAYADELRYIFRCPHYFDSDATSVIFDREFLQQPVVRSRAELKKFLAAAPLGFMSTPADENSISRRVKTTLLAARSLPLTFPPLNSVAHQMSMAESTLRRRLSEESTSYREIKENIRRDLAVQRLLGSSVPVEEIGRLVGYSEARAFTRAFKQWTGHSPGAYRVHLASKFGQRAARSYPPATPVGPLRP
ncbi:AraC family transcriptional regulator [Mycobacterium sp. SMC-19]|uniref:AraC family transcriptional regulator n=1 Tax=Mycobacterium sp. SMC-19 TaxID=3381630 RepID=UPI0038763361